jgi:hypothetical protein
MIRAFLSSTYVDLKEHRACVIGRLTAAGIFVDPMEKWTAASDEPKGLALARLSLAASRQSAALRHGSFLPSDFGLGSHP